jgi:hypothetical protein
MTYTADPKDPAEAVIFSLDIADDLASDGSETISGVTAAVSVHQGEDAGSAAMALGPAGSDGTTISQRVGAGLDGNWYALKFSVTTSLQQTLAYTVLVPVVEGC